MARARASGALNAGRMRWLVVAACLLLAAGACAGSNDDVARVTSTATTPSTASELQPASDWPVSTPEEQGIDSESLADLIDAVAAAGEIHSVMVVRNGHVVLDTVVYPFPENTGHNVYSVSKSVVATLIGIAIDQGLLAGIDVPVVEILGDAAPAAVDERKASMTVEDVLTMSTGLECRDSARYRNQGMHEMLASDDWAAHMLSLPMVKEPGSHFEYCNGATYLLSAIVTEVTGRPAVEFATEALFEPLGITDYTWPNSPQGITFGFSDLVLEPSDMAKIGNLYLQDGKWDGTEVVSASWIEAATAAHPHVTGLPAGTGYGYQWWIDSIGPSARGYGGQRIVVIPDLDMVVVFTAALSPEQDWRPLELIKRHVVRATKPDPLPPNPEAEARLMAAVEAARVGPAPSPVELPETAASINGVRYESQPNDHGHEGFTLTFDLEAAHLTFMGAFSNVFELYPSEAVRTLRGFERTDAAIEVEIALNGRYASTPVWGLPSAWRGHWTADNVFVAEFQTFGAQIARGSFEFTFEGGTANVALREETGGQFETSTASRAS